MDRALAIAHVLGGLLIVFSAMYLLPLAWSIATHDGTTVAFAAALCTNLLAGLGLWLPTRRFQRELQPRDGCLLVVIAWVSMAAFATIPLLLRIERLSFTDAFFETTSGLTTTGATVLAGLDTLAQSLNIWRCALQWYGGMGIIVLAVAVLPMLGVGGMQLFKAETPGPMKETKLTPRITQTAKYLYLIYSGITVLCVLALMGAGMSFYDALCHAFSAMSLGGFSTRDASIMAFNSLAIELVLMFFMLIAVMSFSTHYLAVRQRSWRPYWHDGEVVPALALIAGSCLMLAWFMTSHGPFDSFWPALRTTAFSVVSMATTTGLANTDFDAWPIFPLMWMLFLCTVTSNSGSTGGGIKMIRSIILFKQSIRELMRVAHPRLVNPLLVNGKQVENRVILAVLGFMLLYGLTLIGLTFVMMASGLDLVTALSGVIACLNNTGPGLGQLGPTHNYAWLSDVQTWLLSFAMIAGRLELLTVFALASPAFWRK